MRRRPSNLARKPETIDDSDGCGEDRTHANLRLEGGFTRLETLSL